MSSGFLVQVLVASGCSATDSSSALRTAITCTTQMRPSTGSAGEFAASDTGEGPEGRSVVVTASSPSGEVIVRDLHQYGDGAALRNEFVGGHGFTGLKYVYSHGAELQFYCAAEE